MSKSKEELNQLKEEYESLVSKIKDLDENELNEITGGTIWDISVKLKERFKVDVNVQHTEISGSVENREDK